MVLYKDMRVSNIKIVDDDDIQQIEPGGMIGLFDPVDPDNVDDY